MKNHCESRQGVQLAAACSLPSDRLYETRPTSRLNAVSDYVISNCRLGPSDGADKLAPDRGPEWEHSGSGSFPNKEWRRCGKPRHDCLKQIWFRPTEREVSGTNVPINQPAQHINWSKQTNENKQCISNLLITYSIASLGRGFWRLGFERYTKRNGPINLRRYLWAAYILPFNGQHSIWFYQIN